MIHPDFPDSPPATTDELAFKRIWANKGWQRITPEAKPAPKATTVAAAPPVETADIKPLNEDWSSFLYQPETDEESPFDNNDQGR